MFTSTRKPPLLRTPELQAKTTDPTISYYSSTRIDKLVNILITFVIFCLLVVPVVVMYRITGGSGGGGDIASHPTSIANALLNSTGVHANATLDRLLVSALSAGSGNANTHNTFNAVGVLMVFTLLFSAAMSLLTRAARHELFAASAAYCAILVVFIGNFTG
ncbi:predicted protein [Plenodomus lingam JN3]|uniref:Predicted protein n=1 Tax=Leptosphaeria maculans (strain JN3 / isolate v23.1.3 / race Av1-4-5-6-7-8) TaxID=985895 RepID=E5A4B6_LEPMJ|nr:predicted protein [Plenodomus lingam JN3]CBX98461.1 predicted protein [Plenodomus lingam JN3]